ncbi:bleomycin resistance protein [Sandaracinus amylolyticus]|uniref:Bleomycin resistance protein n=1 Tax=Sandaracinus amylolyticus TaxID=927083 RepID=A0A0F6VYN4_9BACT|nr:VOC family protein [Sandaracinus amylolyticus]AKF02955.1 hypothetical protein DB32_000103 [Sandaracinus amylolyticus]
MAGEVTIPILPVRSIDETIAFYEALGFAVTHRQVRPNGYVVVRREDIELHFFAMPRYDPATSYSTCYIRVPDPDALHASFAAGLKRALGRVPIRGMPRLTKPIDTSYGTRQFGAVDPSGNWLRIGKPNARSIEDDPVALASESELARALRIATRLAESKGDVEAALRVLEVALRRGGGSEAERAAATAYHDELGTRDAPDDPRP